MDILSTQKSQSTGGASKREAPIRPIATKRGPEKDTFIDSIEKPSKKQKSDKIISPDVLCDTVVKRDEAQFRECMRLGADINARENQFGYTSIGLATLQGSAYPMFRTVLEYKPDVNKSISLESGKTPLDEATMAVDVEAVKMLVEAGATLGDEFYRERMPYAWALQEADTEWSAPYFEEIRQVLDECARRSLMSEGQKNPIKNL